MRTLITNLGGLIGSTVTVCGFVDVVRDMKNVQFVVVRDRTGKVQVVHEKQEGGDSLAAQISSLTQESAVSFTGTLRVSPQVKLGGIEIVASSLEIASLAASPLPVHPDSALDLQLDWRWLSLRYPSNRLIFQVQTAMEEGMRQFWADKNFIEIHSPKLMGAASEGGAELFEMPYFGGKAALAQSPQFYKQMAMAAGFERVFEIGPVFRANPSFTSRHDTEFTSIDMEIAWIESHEDVMRLEEEWLTAMLSEVAHRYGSVIREKFGVEVIVPAIPFPRIPLAEGREILVSMGHTIGHREDLDPEGERLLAKHVKETYGHEFVFMTDYPREVRPFYHMRHPSNPSLTRSFDLLWKGLEITTGAQREHRIDILTQQALEKGIDLTTIKSYVDSFRHGMPPHGGMGVGLTRLLMILLNQDNVRKVTYLYRGPNRLTP